MNRKLFESWEYHGMMRMESDGATIWTEASKRLHSGPDRTILGTLLHEGRKAFEKLCEVSGRDPKKLLSDFGLSSEDADYGIALEDE